MIGSYYSMMIPTDYKTIVNILFSENMELTDENMIEAIRIYRKYYITENYIDNDLAVFSIICDLYPLGDNIDKLVDISCLAINQTDIEALEFLSKIPIVLNTTNLDFNMVKSLPFAEGINQVNQARDFSDAYSNIIKNMIIQAAKFTSPTSDINDAIKLTIARFVINSASRINISSVASYVQTSLNVVINATDAYIRVTDDILSTISTKWR